MSNARTQTLADLAAIVGRAHVLTGAAAEPYRTGYRTGGAPVLAAVRPATLVEMWRIAVLCADYDLIIIVQAANTGLTGGSTPEGQYDRPVVVVSTLRIGGVHVLGGGEQVVCLAGSTLSTLERVLAPLGREPHSVIGSSCIGASVVGGVCNNSGGALIQRGPAYTELALYAQSDPDGRLVLRNHLGIRLDGDPETILSRLERGQFAPDDVVYDGRAASAADDYVEVVRQVDATTPARFNADPSRLFEASGSAGHVMVFAVRLDTFPASVGASVFYIGVNDPSELTVLRRRALSEAPELAISAEYIHREAFDLADAYGRDTVFAIRALGASRLPLLFRAKTWLDRIAGRLVPGRRISDRLLQAVGRWLPDPVPARLRAFRRRYEHHLILKVSASARDYHRALLDELFPSGSGAMFECAPGEAELAMLHRFAVAGAAVRRRAVDPDHVGEIVALDVALPRNATQWFEVLPPDIEGALVGKLYYGHFFCHVFHQDYLVKPGVDPVALEHRLLALLDARGAEYPAEHNVGHLYEAKPALAEHYRRLDPRNAYNPGLGGTNRSRCWI
ncbi:D-lactate dehydrogenase [Brevundimonas intermedia]|uniref:D-lactate dehydrogenase n=1 Tax=Brevundimonas intermedia TaxID=74315 RepID=UPI003209C87A